MDSRSVLDLTHRFWENKPALGRTLPAAGIDEATPQGPKRKPPMARQSDVRSYCRALGGPFSDRGVARKARLPPYINPYSSKVFS